MSILCLRRLTSRFIVLFSLLFTTLFAQQDLEEFPFIGLSVSSQNIDSTLNNTRETSIGIRYGKQTQNWRTTFAYDYSKGYQSLSGEIDKILTDELFNTPKIRPFIGFSVGILKLNDDCLSDTSGYYYGGNIGLIFYTTDTMDIDLSYHYNIIQEIEDADNIHGATLSLHYFF